VAGVCTDLYHPWRCTRTCRRAQLQRHGGSGRQASTRAGFVSHLVACGQANHGPDRHFGWLSVGTIERHATALAEAARPGKGSRTASRRRRASVCRVDVDHSDPSLRSRTAVFTAKRNSHRDALAERPDRSAVNPEAGCHERKVSGDPAGRSGNSGEPLRIDGEFDARAIAPSALRCSTRNAQSQAHTKFNFGRRRTAAALGSAYVKALNSSEPSALSRFSRGPTRSTTNSFAGQIWRRLNCR
jgi:hypothetical protein